MARPLIVSAANSTYFPFLQNLISSIRDKPRGKEIAIGVLDVGLRDEECVAVQARVQHLVNPPWEIKFSVDPLPPDHFRAAISRPFLPKYFAGYDLILWIDADAWVQRWSAIEDFLSCAEGGLLAVVQEHDRSYKNVYNFTTSRQSYYESLQKSFGDECVREIGQFPMINSGVFALRCDSPLWRKWQIALAQGVSRVCSHISEQTALNVVAYGARPLPYFLPATHNWVCIQSVPRYDRERRAFVEPLAPYAEIGIVHRTNWESLPSNKKTGVKDLQGNDTSMTLDYGQAGE